MTNRIRSVLWGLRIYGPCSNVALARHLGRDPVQVYRTVYELRGMGLAERLGPERYDISEAGRELLERGGDKVAGAAEPKASSQMTLAFGE